MWTHKWQPDPLQPSPWKAPLATFVGLELRRIAATDMDDVDRELHTLWLEQLQATAKRYGWEEADCE